MQFSLISWDSYRLNDLRQSVPPSCFNTRNPNSSPSELHQLSLFSPCSFLNTGFVVFTKQQVATPVLDETEVLGTLAKVNAGSGMMLQGNLHGLVLLGGAVPVMSGYIAR